MSLKPRLLGSTSFAHLVGLARPAAAAPVPTSIPAAKAEGDDMEDDDARKAREAREEEVKKADDEAKKADDEAKKAEDDAKKAREKAKKAKDKAKKAKEKADRKNDDADDNDPDDDGDDDEDEDEGDDDGDREEASAASPAYAARRRERARCAAIFADPAAALNPALAAQLAFGTSLPRSEAVAVLRAGGIPAASGRRGLADRMQAAGIPAVGPDGAPQPGGKRTPEAIGDEIIHNMEQAKGLVRTK